MKKHLSFSVNPVYIFIKRFAAASLILVFIACVYPVSAEEQPPYQSVIFTFTGDCTLATEFNLINYRTGFVKVVEEKGLDWPFSGALHLFEKDDLTVINLEGVFTNNRRPADRSKKLSFRAPLHYADILTLGSIEAVNLSNNHTLDFGPSGLADTMKTLDDRGIAYCAPAKPVVIQVKGIKVALFGFSNVTGHFRWTEDPHREIAEYRANPDIDLIIVCYHWGVERTTRHSDALVEAARGLIDMGADAVIGTHPHVLQGMELYQGKPIFYSLGNFSFGGNVLPYDHDTAVVQLEYALNEKAAPELARIEVFPFRITSVEPGKYQDYRPVPSVNQKDIKRVFDLLSYKSRHLPADFFKTGLWTTERYNQAHRFRHYRQIIREVFESQADQNIRER